MKYILKQSKKSAVILLCVTAFIWAAGCVSMQKDIDKGKTGDQKYQRKTETDAQIDAKIARLEKEVDWIGYPVAESKMRAKGMTFRQPYQQGVIDFEIYYDEKELGPATYELYNGNIHKDFGWVRDNTVSGGWKATERSKPIKEGIMYIQPVNKVAIYYFKKGEGTFTMLKVRVVKVTD